jgi:hypothetical protein
MSHEPRMNLESDCFSQNAADHSDTQDQQDAKNGALPRRNRAPTEYQGEHLLRTDGVKRVCSDSSDRQKRRKLNHGTINTCFRNAIDVRRGFVT